MNELRPLVRVIIMLLMVAVFSGCAGKVEEGDPTVAIIKFATHPALDATEAGITERLEAAKELHEGLRGLTIESYNAAGDPAKAKQFADIASRSGVDLIIAIATPSAQAVINTESDVPLLFGAVSDPEGAGLLPSSRATGITNVSPEIVRSAADLITTWFKVEAIGTIYNPSEQNSVFVQSLITKEFTRRGIEVVQRQVTDPAMVGAMTEDLATIVPVIYSANDNTVNAAISSIAPVAVLSGVPLVIGDLSTLKDGPLAAIGLDYKDHGLEVGGMAVRLLLGESVADVKPQAAPAGEVWVNEATLKAMELEIPAEAAQLVDQYIQ